MLNQNKIEIFLTKIRKSLAKQFLEITYKRYYYDCEMYYESSLYKGK